MRMLTFINVKETAKKYFNKMKKHLHKLNFNKLHKHLQIYYT